MEFAIIILVFLFLQQQSPAASSYPIYAPPPPPASVLPPTGLPIPPSTPTNSVPGAGVFKNNQLYSPSQWIPGASDPTTFAGQSSAEHAIATFAGKLAPAIANRIPIVGPAFAQVAGPDTEVNVTVTEESVHGAENIATGHFKTGAKQIISSATTGAVQPLKSAYGAAKGFIESL